MRVYFAYSDNSKDIELYNKLSEHLKIFILKKVFESYTDRNSAFASGVDLKDSRNIVENNDVIITLLSSKFISDDIYLNLLKESLIQNKKVLPILGQDCLYSEIVELKPYLGDLIPKERSIAGLSGSAPDPHEVFTDIVEKIRVFILGDIDIDLYSGKHFLWISIVSIILGVISSAFIFKTTMDMVLMMLVLGLFIIISTISLKKYLILNKSL